MKRAVFTLDIGDLPVLLGKHPLAVEEVEKHIGGAPGQIIIQQIA